MKTISKRAVAAVFVAVLAIGPTAAAGPRDRADREIPEKVLRLIKSLQKVFGISSTSNDPVPPRP